MYKTGRGAITIIDSGYINNRLYELGEKHRGISVYSAGKSVLGKELLAASAGCGGSAVILAGGIRGTDAFTSLLLLRFLSEWAESGRTERIIAVPAVNPDGIDIAGKGEAGAGARRAKIRAVCRGDYKNWGANARGVDINHNFSAGFEQLKLIENKAGIFAPSPRYFGGESPESEPETTALTQLCRSKRIKCAISLQGGESDTVYWNYRGQAPAESRKIARALAREGGFYAEEPMGLTSLGSFKDWFISEFGRPAFALTVKRFPADPRASAFTAVYSRVRKILSLAASL